MKRRILICMLLLGLGVGTASAQFGGGIVYDPTNYQNALLRYYQLQQHLVQLQKSYAKITVPTQPRHADGHVHPEHARPLPRGVLPMEERDLAQHVRKYRIMDQRHQFRSIPNINTGYLKATTPLSRTTRTSCREWTPPNLAACSLSTLRSSLPTERT